MPPESNSPKTILLIDDEKAVLTAAALILTRAGYIVVSAESGHGGVTVLDKRADTYKGRTRIDLVIVDWKMPGWDGLRVMAEIRSRPYKETPILLMSGAVTREELLSAAAKNATSVLLKPLVQEILLAKVAEMIGPGNPKPA